MYYSIKNTLEIISAPDIRAKNEKYVAVLTSAQWLENRDKFDMGIEMDMDLSCVNSTKAEVNYDSLTGTFSLPDREEISRPNINFAFTLD
ncbi:MAG: magnesium transporter CorA, partial [Ruminococcus sp.]|nr:magnesium transporter CorA [Ruminococcus sp.]